ncbi:hypothetical protein FRB95_010933 [Tulasnella sp. JGI-2019a]|nr:hypothetical protein FRB93_011054 [Tulasnella sp. JGI-2019a]KAG9024898.1 hypothetical protein FRB95_010933 [Tulasnella sp. JGI-2019a]
MSEDYRASPSVQHAQYYPQHTPQFHSPQYYYYSQPMTPQPLQQPHQHPQQQQQYPQPQQPPPPQESLHQTQPPSASTSQASPSVTALESPSGILASRTEDWTESLVKLAKSAELKKHALTLQMHTSRIVAYNLTLQKKERSMGAVRKQKESLEAQHTQLLNKLRVIDENREKAELEEAKALRECEEMRTLIKEMTEGEYTAAKTAVDRLRQELDMDPAPSLERKLEEKRGRHSTAAPMLTPVQARTTVSDARVPTKRTSSDRLATSTESLPVRDVPPAKRPRGRPKGSKNKPRDGMERGPEAGAGSQIP